MLRKAIVILLFIPQLVHSQTSDLPFQILVARDVYVFGKPAEPLTFIDDVTSLDVKPGGFLALVHKGGTTYELKEKIFTFYLKPEELKDVDQWPKLEVLYQDLPLPDPTETITVLHPLFNRDRTIIWGDSSPLEVYWHLPNEPVLVYKVTVRDHNGQKIQDFGTRKHKFTLKPYNFGLDEREFIFLVSSTFAGETTRSMEYTIQLEKNPPASPQKASDLVLKACNLELSPVAALEVWKEVLGMDNGKFYFELFEKFINRNKEVLAKSGEDIEQLLTQNK